MIAVLPLLLYPLLGMSFFQVAQFLREQPTRVLVVDSARGRGTAAAWSRTIASPPALFADKPERARLLHVDVCARLLPRPRSPAEAAEPRPSRAEQEIHRQPRHRLPRPTQPTCAAMRGGSYDVVIRLPARLCRAHCKPFAPDCCAPAAGSAGRRGRRTAQADRPTEPPADGRARPTTRFPARRSITIRPAKRRRSRFCGSTTCWPIGAKQIGEENLRQSHLPATAARPFRRGRRGRGRRRITARWPCGRRSCRSCCCCGH